MSFNKIKENLRGSRYRWCITGVAGFIGSNILEFLLLHDQEVVGIDDFSTGYKKNLDDVRKIVTTKQWNNFDFFEGDICDIEDCKYVTKDIDFVLHQAALGSVPRSVEDPIKPHQSNVNGFLNMIITARDAGVKRFVFASSSSVYGDFKGSPKDEDITGNLLSPYAATKYIDEIYAGVFSRCYDFEYVGLRYFNVFGQRQDPNGAYAAVIPRWIWALLCNDDIFIYGDGETSRDFTFIENVVQVNILAALVDDHDAINQIYNVAFGEKTTLNDLFILLKKTLKVEGIECFGAIATYKDFRGGDIRHSLANISKARKLLGYEPLYTLKTGLQKCITSYVRRFNPSEAHEQV